MANRAVMAALLAFFAPQGPVDELPTRARAIVVGGALDERGGLRVDRLGLGNGGVGQERARAMASERGVWRSPGGVLVRARREGVKLDFPSGAELLVSPAARVHLRDGGRTLPCLGGLELWLADGAHVRAWRAPTGRGPLQRVEVVVAGAGARTIFKAGHRVHEASWRRQNGRTVLLVVGRGDVLYSASPLGPLVVLERVLCPRAKDREYPRRRLVVVGDVLRDSLERLPAHVPRRMIQMPQAREAALTLAALAPRLFAKGILPRPAGAVGALVFPLGGDFRLMVRDDPRGPVTLGLMRGSSDVPAVEWVVGARTTLHLVRPDGGRHGGPRYFLKGLDLEDLVRPLLPLRLAPRARRRARVVLRGLGA